jgi:hypothetical protein
MDFKNMEDRLKGDLAFKDNVVNEFYYFLIYLLQEFMFLCENAKNTDWCQTWRQIFVQHIGRFGQPRLQLGWQR